jgi:hypothetical protein
MSVRQLLVRLPHPHCGAVSSPRATFFNLVLDAPFLPKAFFPFCKEPGTSDLLLASLLPDLFSGCLQASPEKPEIDDVDDDSPEKPPMSVPKVVRESFPPSFSTAGIKRSATLFAPPPSRPTKEQDTKASPGRLRQQQQVWLQFAPTVA